MLDKRNYLDILPQIICTFNEKDNSDNTKDESIKNFKNELQNVLLEDYSIISFESNPIKFRIVLYGETAKAFLKEVLSAEEPKRTENSSKKVIEITQNLCERCFKCSNNLKPKTVEAVIEINEKINRLLDSFLEDCFVERNNITEDYYNKIIQKLSQIGKATEKMFEFYFTK